MTDLGKLLKLAAKHELTPREIWDQRVSFAFGNLPFLSRITREQVEDWAVEMYGPRPAE